jgi:hypothetical protein
MKEYLDGEEFNLKKVHLSIVNLPLFRDKVIPKPEIQISDESTFFDMIATLDQYYWREVHSSLSKKDQNRVFLFKTSKSLLHTLWDPTLNKTYKDVMLEARECFSSRKKLPILEDFEYIIPEGAYFAIGPDEG